MVHEKQNRKRKNIDVSTECVKRLSKLAIDKGTTFKQLAEKILSEYCETGEQRKDKKH